MTILKLFNGDQGKAGKDGINGLGPSDVNSFNTVSPILDALNPNKLSKNAFVTFSRDRLATYMDRYGNYSWSEPTSSTNYIENNTNFSTWQDFLNNWSIIGDTTDPYGGDSATEINLDLDTENPSGVGPVMSITVPSLTAGGYAVVSCWVRVISGTGNTLDFSIGADVFNSGSIESQWERKFIKAAITGSTVALDINLRGKAGDRFAVYRPQLEYTVLTDEIATFGIPLTVTNEGAQQSRQSDKGYLCEGEKQNLCHFTNDFKEWSVTNSVISDYEGLDQFGFPYANIKITFPSLPSVTLSTTTEPLIDGQEYNVSFWAWVEQGSLTSLTVNLGGGVSVSAPQPSVTGLQRISMKCTAGVGDTININATSNPLTAVLYISCIQVEAGDLSSYTEGSNSGQTRLKDEIDTNYKYSVPKPSLPWTMIFGKEGMQDTNSVKTIFSNGESGGDEFSLKYQGRILTLVNGSNSQSYDTFDYKKVAISYDGATVKFYGEQELILEEPMSSTAVTTNNFYLGYNGVNEHANCYLFSYIFYNVELTLNEIQYVMGA